LTVKEGAEAEEIHQRVLHGHEITLGAENTSALLTVQNPGSLYQVQGKLVEAEEMYQRAWHGYEKAL